MPVLSMLTAHRLDFHSVQLMSVSPVFKTLTALEKEKSAKISLAKLLKNHHLSQKKQMVLL